MSIPNLQNYRVESWTARDGNNKYNLNFDLNRDSLVFEIGGYLGDWAESVVKKFGCRVYVFEPVPEYVNKLEERFTGNDLVRIFPFGLSDKTEEIELSLTNDASSILVAAHLQEKRIKVKMVRAVDFLAEQNIEKVDLVQMNIEGAEYELLPDLIESGSIRQIENIIIQFHDFVANAAAKHADLQNKLYQTHYMLFQHPFVWEGWRLQPSATESHAQFLEQLKFDQAEIVEAREEVAKLRHALAVSEQDRSNVIRELASLPKGETLVQKIKRKLGI